MSNKNKPTDSRVESLPPVGSVASGTPAAVETQPQAPGTGAKLADEQTHPVGPAKPELDDHGLVPDPPKEPESTAKPQDKPINVAIVPPAPPEPAAAEKPKNDPNANFRVHLNCPTPLLVNPLDVNAKDAEEAQAKFCQANGIRGSDHPWTITQIREANGMRTDGPTLQEFVDAGYKAEDYPPPGYAYKPPK